MCHLDVHWDLFLLEDHCKHGLRPESVGRTQFKPAEPHMVHTS